MRLRYLGLAIAALVGIAWPSSDAESGDSSPVLASHGLVAAGSSARAKLSFTSVAGNPFGTTVTRNGQYAFVDLLDNRLLVYSLSCGTPKLLRTITLPDPALGSSLTANGRLLLIADDHGGAIVVNAARAERGSSHAVLGMLNPPSSQLGTAGGAIETSTSPNGRYAFISLEYGRPNGAIAVYDLGNDRVPHLGQRGWVGQITLGQAVVGSALSPDGRYLYVTSEIASGGTIKTKGTLSVIDVSRAEKGSPNAVLATVPADHQPVRVVVSPSGRTVWVTARSDNEVLAFSASQLETDASPVPLATIKAGTSPVGLALFDRGSRLLVADSDRFNTKGAHAGLTIINTRAALAHRPAIVATARSGKFPREIAIDPSHGEALISNFSSNQLEILGLSQFG